ncbi:FUSC family protein [Photobacterium nomapromontoriensis]|uniref:FUSC family protein n=1 Tax=Photobacterium nomapromontoriensis TaxID=2910237 RepID=UPI003D147F3F
MSEKFKFACRVAVSLTLAYLIPMALGWNQPSTAATTVMLIASIGSRKESLTKGTLRVLGTIAGGIIGLLLVGLFAQDRLLYMLSVSITITLIFYIRSAYLKDPTLFMLTGVMVLMMYNGGDAEGAFLYGIDRTFMTVFGVVIYTLVGLFLFPPKVERNLQQLAVQLAAAQAKLFEYIGSEGNAETEKSNEEPPVSLAMLSQQLFDAQQAFELRYQALSSECSEFSAYKKEWDGAVGLFHQMTELLIFAAKEQSRSDSRPESYIVDYQALRQQTLTMFEQLSEAWQLNAAQPPLTVEPIEYDEVRLQMAGHFERGEVITTAYLLGQIREKLTKLHSCISSIDSVTGIVDFPLPSLPQPPSFNWWDAENAKTAVKVFVTYWAVGWCWITFNPPGGYNLVVFGTLFVSILSYMPIHPALLFVLFTLGFAFSVPAYVFLLPQLTLGIELGIFIFAYTFIAFYLFRGPITIFFLLGMFTLGIDNNMVYHFGIVLTVVTLFYLTVVVVVLSYYFPFSGRPERLLLVFRERFFRHACGIIQLQQQETLSWWQRNVLAWRIAVMTVTLKKIKIWSSKIDYKDYPEVSPDVLMAFVDQCDRYHHHLMMLVKARAGLALNPLVAEARARHQDHVIPTMASQFAIPPVSLSHQSGEALVELRQDYQELESQLDRYFSAIEWAKYSKSNIAGFYIFLNLKKNIFDSLAACKRAHDDVPWTALAKTTF